MIPDSFDNLPERMPQTEGYPPVNTSDRDESAPVRKKRVLVVEDEADIAELVRYHLGREGLIVSICGSGEEALESVRSSPPDAVVLDIMLPGINGLEVCRALRREPATSQVPVIMLTARSEDDDVVAGLECGADDYVTKPFSPRVLSARVKAVLRKRMTSKSAEPPSLEFGDLTIHPGRHEVRVSGNPIDLTYTEFRILLTLARRPGWVYSREQIVDSARGGNAVVTPRSVDVHVVRLRSKLGSCGDLIETVRGLGYRLREP